MFRQHLAVAILGVCALAETVVRPGFPDDRFRPRCLADFSTELHRLSWTVAANQRAAARPQKLRF